MISKEEMKEKVEQTRRDGLMVFSLSEGPLLLSDLVKIVQDIFPNHSLDQLAITEVDDEDDVFVVAAQLGIETRGN